MKAPDFKYFLIAVSGILLAGMIYSCEPAGSASESEEGSSERTKEELIARGAYLTRTMDCEVCHSPKFLTPQGPVVDSTRRFSGHPSTEPDMPLDTNLTVPGRWTMANPSFTAWYGPWGSSYAANITPDASGIGDFTLDHFRRAFTQGKYRGVENGRSLLPPMPWPAYSIINDDDLEAIYTFLQSLPPVKNVVPAPKSREQLAGIYAASQADNGE